MQNDFGMANAEKVDAVGAGAENGVNDASGMNGAFAGVDGELNKNAKE